jgi:hypothetical protein
LKPTEVLREVVYPLTDMTVLLAIVGFTIVALLARAAGLLGLLLGLLLLPALYRYLLLLLEERAYGRSAPVAGIELFDIADNFWSLTPLIITAVAIWGTILLESQVSALLARLFGLGIVIVLPASLAVLAITRSPLESLNPAAWRRLMQACGRDYWLLVAVPLVTVSLTLLIPWPGTLAGALFVSYQLFLLFTLTGAVVHANGVQLQLAIPDPVEPGEDSVADARERDRRVVLNHAYGFVSRGNLAGGLEHIESAIRDDPHPGDAWRWYIDRMLEWDSSDAALVLAQAWLGRLLAEQRDIEALKLMTRCLLENPAFRPLPADRETAMDLARRFDRDDLLKSLA